MDVIDLDSSDSSDHCDITGFSRKRPSASRHRKQQQHVPSPILVPQPRQQRQQPQQKLSKKPQQQRLQNREYPVVAAVDLTISDEEDGEIVEDIIQNANDSNAANSTLNGNLNLPNNQNENGIELDVLPLNVLEIKREAIEMQIKEEEGEQCDLEPVSDDDGNDITPPNATPMAASVSLEDVSDDDDFSAITSNSNETSMQSNTANRTVEMKPMQTPRSSAWNSSMQSLNNSLKRAQPSPNQTVQSFSESLENVSDDDELLPPPSSKKHALNLNEKRVVFSARRPVAVPNKIESQAHGSNGVGKLFNANEIQRVFQPRPTASKTSMQSQNSPPNHAVQSHTSNASIQSASRSQFPRNEAMQTIDSNRTKNSPVHSKSPNQHVVSSSSSHFWNKIEQKNHQGLNGSNFSENNAIELRKYGIFVSSDADADEASQSVVPNQAPFSFMPDEAATHGLSHQMHSNRTDTLPMTNQRSPIYAPPDTASNSMLSQNVDNFVRQKTPVRERAPQTPESGIAASDISSDFELDLYSTNAPSNREAQKNQKTTCNENRTCSNHDNQENHAGHLNNSSSNSRNPPPNGIDWGNRIKSSVKSIFFEEMSKHVSKKRKTPSPSASSSDSDEDLMQPSENQPKNSPNASHGGNCSKRQRSDSETDSTSATSTEEESNDGVDTQNEDPTYEPDIEQMEVDNREDENDAYDSDCSGFSTATKIFEQPCRKPAKGESEESSRDSDETIIDFSQYFRTNDGE